MGKITKKSQITLMYVFTSLVYFMSYITRVNYNTILVELSSAENISRSLLALPLTASFVTYGFGQIISGWLGDKFDPFKLISGGLVLSALMNALLPLFPKPQLMIVFWAVNGFAQALIYPPLMKITAHYLTEENYSKACLLITIGSYAATLLMYIAAPAIISVSGWRFVFGFSFLCAVVFLAVWQVYSGKIKKNYGGITAWNERKMTENKGRGQLISLKALLLSSGLIIIMAAVVMQGFLRDGITTWMPAYLSDVFSLSNEISILTTVILPIFSIISSYVILKINTRLCNDELKLAGIVFLVAVASIVFLLLFRENIVMSVLLLAFTSACAYSVNFLLVCFVPVRFEKYGRFSLVTGLVNSCTYVGAAISMYGFAVATEKYGWNFTLLLWMAIALIGFLCCFAALRKWKKRQYTKGDNL